MIRVVVPAREVEKIKLEESRNAIKVAFQGQRSGAKLRGIPWELTFEQWCDIWLESGKWPKRGPRLHQYCMARKLDNLGFTVDNVEIITHAENREQKANGFWNIVKLIKNTRT